MEIKKSLVTVEDIDVPAVLHKYRTWDVEIHKRVITEQEVFFSPPSWFYDKKDCRIYRKYDYTDEEIFNIYSSWLRREHPPRNIEDIKELSLQAIGLTQGAPLRDEVFLERFKEREFEQLNRMLGILSLSEFNNTIEMWNEYASSGAGICIGLNGKEVVKLTCNYAKVNYVDVLPEIVLGEPFETQLWKQMFNKEISWTHEHEHRMRMFKIDGLSDNDRVMKLTKQCFNEIVFGWAVSEKTRTEVIKACTVQHLPVKYYQATLADNIVSISQL